MNWFSRGAQSLNLDATILLSLSPETFCQQLGNATVPVALATSHVLREAPVSSEMKQIWDSATTVAPYIRDVHIR
jgi:hypothetical protein